MEILQMMRSLGEDLWFLLLVLQIAFVLSIELRCLAFWRDLKVGTIDPSRSLSCAQFTLASEGKLAANQFVSPVLSEVLERLREVRPGGLTALQHTCRPLPSKSYASLFFPIQALLPTWSWKALVWRRPSNIPFGRQRSMCQLVGQSARHLKLRTHYVWMPFFLNRQSLAIILVKTSMRS